MPISDRLLLSSSNFSESFNRNDFVPKVKMLNATKYEREYYGRLVAHAPVYTRNRTNFRAFFEFIRFLFHKCVFSMLEHKYISNHPLAREERQSVDEYWTARNDLVAALENADPLFSIKHTSEFASNIADANRADLDRKIHLFCQATFKRILQIAPPYEEISNYVNTALNDIQLEIYYHNCNHDRTKFISMQQEACVVPTYQEEMRKEVATLLPETKK